MGLAARNRKLSPSFILLSIFAALLALEVGLRFSASAPLTNPSDRSSSVPLHVVVDSPELFRLNANHPLVSSQGLRNREVPFLKPSGNLRILVLGDSVTFGSGVESDRVFTTRLESLFAEAGTPAEVINMGVPGYTPYNELQFFRSHGRHFDADVVFVVFSVDDVANPRLHWPRFVDVDDIPKAALPNSRYDREVIQPRLERGSTPQHWATRSYLLRELGDRFRWLRLPPPEGTPDWDARPPTFITLEDNLGIEVIADAHSSEWQWLIRMYEQLQTAVESGGALFVIAIAPAAYQLETGGAPYPYEPQRNFADHCERKSIPCIDLLETMAGRTPEELFLLDEFGRHDVRHLNVAGHELVAAAIAEFFSVKRDS